MFCITKYLLCAVDTSIFFNSICHIISLFFVLFNYQVKLETAFIKKNKNKKDEEKKKDAKKAKEKKEEVDKGEEKNPIYKHVREKFLCQHGAELLIEKENSVFQSGVAGFLCIGTKVSKLKKIYLNQKGLV